MKAVIITGDGGKRLEPLTYTANSSMVRFFSKPLIEYQLGLMSDNGFDEVHLYLGYMADGVEQYVKSRRFENMKIICHRAATSLGTAGGIRAVAKDFSEPFLVIASNCICDFRLSELMDYHLSRRADVTVACIGGKSQRGRTAIEIDDFDKVKAFTENLPFSGAVSDRTDTGIYVFGPEVTQYIPEGKPSDLFKDLFPMLMKQGKSVVHYQAEGYWRNIATAADYLAGHWDIFDMKSKIRLSGVTGGVYSDGALASGDYSVIEPCFIGKDVRIASGAVIGPYAVIDSGCRIGKNAKIVRSCMLENSSLGDNSSLNGAILCPKANVGAGCRVDEGAVIGDGAKVNSSGVVGSGVVIPPESRIEPEGRITRSFKYSQTAMCLNDSNRFSGKITTDFDAVNAAVIGQALASMEIGRKTGIVTDGKVLSKAVAHCITGAMMSHSANVWSFGEGFYSQLEFYVRFCSLKSGVFISSDGDRVSVSICGENGLPLVDSAVSELENRIKYRDFLPCRREDMKDVSDMTGVAMMYRREIIRQTDTELSDVSCIVKCPNEKITMLLEDCLYQLGCRSGDEITFKINAYGNLLSAFSRECGWIVHDRLAAIVLINEAQHGRNVSVAFSSPEIYDRIAAEHGSRVLRYSQFSADAPDSTAREMSRGCPFMRDALLMAVKLLNIICTTGKSLARLNRDVPDFYVSRVRIPLTCEPSEIAKRLGDRDFETTREGITLRFEQGRVLLSPSRSGRNLSILAEAANYEISKDLCARAERLIKGKKQ